MAFHLDPFDADDFEDDKVAALWLVVQEAEAARRGTADDVAAMERAQDFAEIMRNRRASW